MRAMLVCLFLGVSTSYAASIQEFKRVLTASDGLQCEAHILSPAGKDVGAVLFVEFGTGIYSSLQYVSSHLSQWFTETGLAIVAIEKPGVSYSNDAMTIDRFAFSQHSRSTLASCLAVATEWTLGEFPQIKKYLFWGHSEGGQVVNLAVAKYFSQKVIERIRYIVISSPADDFNSLLQYQLGDEAAIERFRLAIESEDNEFLMSKRSGSIPASYWNSVLQSESHFKLLQENLIAFPEISYAVYYGDCDRQCDPKHTESFFTQIRERYQQLRVFASSDGHCLSSQIDEILAGLSSNL